jgi:hypothetical protein
MSYLIRILLLAHTSNSATRAGLIAGNALVHTVTANTLQSLIPRKMVKEHRPVLFMEAAHQVQAH